MGLASGLAAQLGFKSESVYGTGVAVDTFCPFVSESLTEAIDQLMSKGIIAGARLPRSQQWAQGNHVIAGALGLELYDRTTAILFKHMLGAVVTTGSGPYVHTLTPGDLTGKSLSIQVGVPDNTATVQPFTFAGCKIPKWQLGLKKGEIATLGLDIVGKTATTATGLASASMAASIAPITFNGATVTLGGGAYKFAECTLNGDNGLDVSRFFAGQTSIDEPLEAQLRSITGMLESELAGLTAYNRFVNATEAALVLHLAKGASTLDITMNVKFNGSTPVVPGPAIVRQPLPFEVIGTTTDALGITAVLTNTDASAA